MVRQVKDGLSRERAHTQPRRLANLRSDLGNDPHDFQTRHKKRGSLPVGRARRRPTECAVGTRRDSSTSTSDCQIWMSTEKSASRVTDFDRATPSLRQPTPRLILIVARELRE